MRVLSQMSFLIASRGSCNNSMLSLSCRSAACLKIRSGKQSIVGSRLTGLAAHSQCTTLDANNESLWSVCKYRFDPPPPNRHRCSWNPWWGPVAPLRGYRAEAPDTRLKSAHVFNSRINENTYLIDGDNYLTSLRDQLKAWVKSECRRCELPWRNSCDKDLLKSDRFTIDCRWVQAVLITDLATSRFDSPPAVRPAIQCADTCIKCYS